MSNDAPTLDLGHQLLQKLEADGSAPALALLGKLQAANGNLTLQITAIEEAAASDVGLPAVLVTDETGVLVGWLFQRVNHWAFNHGLAVSPLVPAPARYLGPPAA